MEIIQEQNGPLEAVIRITLTEEDYRGQVDKELKNLQKKAQMPGFRPGKVPLGLVKKMYGKSVVAEEVNKILADSVYNYIKEKELNVLGSPIPDREMADSTDWETQVDFTFQYQIGLAPDIDLELTNDIEVKYYNVGVSDGVVDDYVQDLRKRYGKMTNPGVAGDEDVLFGEFAEMENVITPKTEGHTHKANLYIQYIKDEAMRDQLVGKKPGEQVVMDVAKAVGSETEAAAMIGVKKEELENVGPLFRFTVESISRVEPAVMDEAFFKQAAPDRDIRTEEGFREFIREQVGKQYQADADKHFRNMVKEKLLEMTSLELPERFLKKWLLDTNQEELTEEKVEKEFDQYSDTFRWQLLENHLIKQNDIEVKPEEVNEELEKFVKAQLKQYGQDNVPKEMLDEYVKNIASNKEEVKKVYDHLYEQKLLDLFKQKLLLLEEDISYDDFVKLVTEKYKKGSEGDQKE